MTGAGRRSSGILLHITSLPGRFAIGDIGPCAVRFLDWLRDAGQRLWQVLPLGPTGYGNSPYACFSSFAGNPLLVSPEALASWGVVSANDVSEAPPPSARVDYAAVMAWKLPLLRNAADAFLSAAPATLRSRYEAFRSQESWWLDDYSLFAGIKSRYPGAWNRAWPRELALRHPDAVDAFRREHREETERQRVIQFFFFSQWADLRAEAARREIAIIGDLPIFAAPDSADVWSHPGHFLLDAEGMPTVVSGVPPDYFAATGQLWGNPLYDWDELARQGFRFWVDRIRAARRLFDLIRVDHFRGFDACWTVPASAPTAESGRWMPVPGAALFQTLQRELGDLPILAEDLGVITPSVVELRERFKFPGMRILQFAFDQAEAGRLDATNRFLPHNYTPDSVVYTGTHDNDTTRGWFKTRTAAERDYLSRYAATTEPEVEWKLIRMAMASVAGRAIVPLQDVLGLGGEARMNTPGTSGEANWSWRAREDALDPATAVRLRELATLFGRCP